jgi:hypothetical protein
MHTILQYPNGRRADGIILSASQDIMRVVVRRSADTVELRRVGGVWTSEDGSRIEFALMAIAGKAVEAKPHTFTAGGQAFLPV